MPDHLQCVAALIAVTFILVAHVEAALVNAGQDRDVKPHHAFPAHKYQSDLKTRWADEDIQADQDEAVASGSFTVIFHGMKGAGKTAMIQRLCQKHSDDGDYVPTVESAWHSIRIGSERIGIIDTPGFGNPSEGGKYQCLMGITGAASLVVQNQIEVRRIYFFLDFDKDRDQVPETIVNNLKAISLAYGIQNQYDVVFVISKCDLIKDLYDRDQFLHWREVAASMADQFWGDGMRYLPESVLLVSARDCCRSLTLDMCRASRSNMPISVPGPIIKSKWIKYDRLFQIIGELQKHMEAYHFKKDISYAQPQDLSSLQQICREVSEKHIGEFCQDILEYKKRIDDSANSEKIATTALSCVPVVSLIGIATRIASDKHVEYSCQTTDLHSKIQDFIKELQAMLPQNLCQ